MRMRCVVGGSYWSSCAGCARAGMLYELRDLRYFSCIISATDLKSTCK